MQEDPGNADPCPFLPETGHQPKRKKYEEGKCEIFIVGLDKSLNGG
jgi:hypothetical protein